MLTHTHTHTGDVNDKLPLAQRAQLGETPALCAHEPMRLGFRALAAMGIPEQLAQVQEKARPSVFFTGFAESERETRRVRVRVQC